MSDPAVRPSNTTSFSTVRHAAVIDTLLKLLQEIRFGAIELTIHDSTIVQIERREKIRL